MRSAVVSEPLESFRRISKRPYAFFLDSSNDDRKLGRYSIIGSDPFLVFRSKGRNISLEYSDGRKKSLSGNPFLELKKLLARYKTPRLVPGNQILQGVGAAVGYFAYDLKDFVEKLPDRARDDLGLPDCILGFYDKVTVFDNAGNRRAPLRVPYVYDSGLAHSPIKLKSNFTFDAYVKAVKKAKDYIKRGDIYQVNLSQRFETDFSGDPFGLYCRLREASPAPFSSYLDFGGVKVLSSSPERFLLKRGDYIETRPIKGTRPRDDDVFRDSLLEKELADSAKDRAEHIMIVDLERNDLGRICEYGSVKPTELFTLEKYSTVSHLVSTVSGKLKDGVDAVDCLMAAFPGGSITGAPKIRSMEIIEELEPVKRSIYTGAVGYISFDGNMDTSIVIRTFVLAGGKAYFQVGGGIVADSDPAAEYRETLDKARGLMSALGVHDDQYMAQQQAR